jgi:hypothetical protein
MYVLCKVSYSAWKGSFENVRVIWSYVNLQFLNVIGIIEGFLSFCHDWESALVFALTKYSFNSWYRNPCIARVYLYCERENWNGNMKLLYLLNWGTNTKTKRRFFPYKCRNIHISYKQNKLNGRVTKNLYAMQWFDCKPINSWSILICSATGSLFHGIFDELTNPPHPFIRSWNYQGVFIKGLGDNRTKHKVETVIHFHPASNGIPNSWLFIFFKVSAEAIWDEILIK